MKKTLQRSLLGTLSDVSGTNTYRSLWQPIDSFEKYMIQIVYTGAPSGTVTLSVSADPVPSLESFDGLENAAPVNYDTAANSSTTTAGKNIITYEVLGTAASWVSVQWTNASGNGTITSINFIGKGSLV